MLHHRTSDPAKRARHVAERESRDAYDDTYNVLLARYDDCLLEFTLEAAELANDTEENGCNTD